MVPEILFRVRSMQNTIAAGGLIYVMSAVFAFDQIYLIKFRDDAHTA